MVTEQFAEGTYVGVVLEERIEQLVFVAEDVLCPFLCVFGAIDPALVVFCLDDEDAVWGHYNMVYLRGSRAGCVGNHDVVKDGVFSLGQSTQAKFDVSLTVFACSLGSGQTQPYKQHKYRHGDDGI